MSALFTALLEGESKESLAAMVCELREALKGLVERGTDSPEHRAEAAIAKASGITPSSTDSLSPSGGGEMAQPQTASRSPATKPSDMLETASFLFALLDDIDTASDMAKSDDGAYRKIVERLQRRRFEVASTDGHAVTFHARKP